MNVTLQPHEEKLIARLATERGESPRKLAKRALRAGLRFLEKNRAKSKSSKAEDPAYAPSKTPIGRKLRALRRKYVEGGGKLYSLAEINAEVAEGRGER